VDFSQRIPDADLRGWTSIRYLLLTLSILTLFSAGVSLACFLYYRKANPPKKQEP
jgi:hypothetical protein